MKAVIEHGLHIEIKELSNIICQWDCIVDNPRWPTITRSGIGDDVPENLA